CPQCDHAFKKREHLVRHVRSHTKEKPFVCDICSKSYGRRYALTPSSVASWLGPYNRHVKRLVDPTRAKT
ncbi:hypothetical protein IWW34DRAFT_636984, partial [Fusarium oxysporum f. sp. albedinis]